MNVIELAREAGFNEAETEILKQEIASFADLVRAAALEEAAEEAMHWVTNISTHSDAEYVAAAIRALKEKT